MVPKFSLVTKNDPPYPMCVAQQGWVNLAAAGWRSRAERGRGTPRTFLGGGAGAHDVPAEVEQPTRRRNGHSKERQTGKSERQKMNLTFLLFKASHGGEPNVLRREGCDVC